MRNRPVLTGLLAALLLLQWSVAFAHCLKLTAPAAGLAVEICTVEGLRHVVLPEPGDGQQDRHDGLAARMLCPACQGPAAVALPTPPVTLGAPVLLAQAADPPPPSSPAPVPSPTPHCQPRAPPPTS